MDTNEIKKWKDKEKRDAQDFCANQTPRSGGMWSSPGDMQDKLFSYDSKYTKHKSFSISSLLWRKIYKDALKQNKLPVVSIELGTGEELVVLSKADFIWLKKEAETPRSSIHYDYAYHT